MIILLLAAVVVIALFVEATRRASRDDYVQESRDA